MSAPTTLMRMYGPLLTTTRDLPAQITALKAKGKLKMKGKKRRTSFETTTPPVDNASKAKWMPGNPSWGRDDVNG